MSKNEDQSNLDNSDKAAAAREERREAPDYDKFFNKQFSEKPRYIEPGQVMCGNEENAMYVATVGSGVVVTMYDTELKLGGMCYILIPADMLKTFPHFEQAGDKARKAAIEPLDACIAEMKKRGAGKHRIQMRLIGGGRIPGDSPDDAGTKNYIFVRDYVSRKGLMVLNEDLGGKYVRRVHFFPTTGRAVRMVLRRDSDISAIQMVELKAPQ